MLGSGQSWTPASDPASHALGTGLRMESENLRDAGGRYDAPWGCGPRRAVSRYPRQKRTAMKLILSQLEIPRTLVLGALLATAGLASANTGLDDTVRPARLDVPADAPTIQQAIDIAAPGTEIVVADGVWRGIGNRDMNFGGKDLVVRSANGAANCIIDCEGTPQDPHRAFVFSSGETRAATVQGFTIIHGATLDGAIADQFNGGAIQVTVSSPTLIDNIFRDNYAGCWGAAVYSGHLGAPRIERCLFENNVAGDDGGGFFTWDFGQTEIVRSAFIGNRAAVTGGAISSFGGTPLLLENLTLVGNEAPFGSAIFTSDEIVLRNSIVWDNPTTTEVLYGHSSQFDVQNSIVEGGFFGLGNRDVDPRLAADRVHLLPGSPALDASWDSMLEVSRNDFEGDRPAGEVDLGADEFMPGTDSSKSTGPGPFGGLGR